MENSRIARRARVDDIGETRKWMKKAVDSLPSNLRGRGWLLIELMDQNRFMLSESGEFIPQKTKSPIPGSYIQLLLLHFLNALYSPDMEANEILKPPGFNKFVQQVNEYMDPNAVEQCFSKPKRARKRKAECMSNRRHKVSTHTQTEKEGGKSLGSRKCKVECMTNRRKKVPTQKEVGTPLETP